MTRLQAELQRLYLTPGPGVRAALIELARPAGWDALRPLWRGVQADLGLPAPAIAINGRDGYQLWFSFAEALPAAQAADFIEALRRRYLGDVAAARLTLSPSTGGPPQMPLQMPPQQTQGDQWSAFVAPDLAPVFADEPWVDLPPVPDGQADLLSRLTSINAADFRAAAERLGAAPQPPAPQPAEADPRGFLTRVMNDESVPLALRIEAAKALLGR